MTKLPTALPVVEHRLTIPSRAYTESAPTPAGTRAADLREVTRAEPPSTSVLPRKVGRSSVPAKLTPSPLQDVLGAAYNAADQPTQVATLVVYSHDSPTPTYLQLPPVPSGCLVRVYHIEPEAFRDSPRNKIDWAPFLRALGVIFPRGGFASYFAASSTLIVANTPEQLQLLDPF